MGSLQRECRETTGGAGRAQDTTELNPRDSVAHVATLERKSLRSMSADHTRLQAPWSAATAIACDWVWLKVISTSAAPLIPRSVKPSPCSTT